MRNGDDMLLSFSVENFKSFNKEGKISMNRGTVLKKKEHLMKFKNVEVLKGAVIYGSNAGGKSSFIDAMYVSRRIILATSEEHLNRKDIDIKNCYCRIYEDNQTRPTVFEYVFTVKDRCYKYRLEMVLSELKVVYEDLSECITETDTIKNIFTREGNDYNFESGGYFTEEEVTKLNNLTSDLVDSSEHLTFISTVTYNKKFSEDSNLRVFNEVTRWFGNNLMVKMFRIQSKEESLSNSEILNLLIPDFGSAEYVPEENLPKQFVDMADAFIKNTKGNSVAITDYCVEMGEDGALKTYAMKTHHNSSDGSFDLREESDGTIETLKYSQFLSDNNDDITFIVDEFGSKMHPLLAKRFIELFYSLHEEDNIQLIMATHHTSIMTLDLFRADEIWFVDKKNGESELYSLEEFMPRSDIAVDRNYLAGRYGALPIFDEW